MEGGGGRAKWESCTYRAFPQLRRERKRSDARRLARRGNDRRTEHLQGLPDGLFVEDMTCRVRVVTVLDALHVLRPGKE